MLTVVAVGLGVGVGLADGDGVALIVGEELTGAGVFRCCRERMIPASTTSRINAMRAMSGQVHGFLRFFAAAAACALVGGAAWPRRW